MDHKSKTAIEQLGRARKHLEASGLSSRMVSALLALWIDQVDREDAGGVTLKEWIGILAPWAEAEEQRRLLDELLNSLPKMFRSGHVVRERHSDGPHTYRILMPMSFHGVWKTEEDPWF